MGAKIAAKPPVKDVSLNFRSLGNAAIAAGPAEHCRESVWGQREVFAVVERRPILTNQRRAGVAPL